MKELLHACTYHARSYSSREPLQSHRYRLAQRCASSPLLSPRSQCSLRTTKGKKKGKRRHESGCLAFSFTMLADGKRKKSNEKNKKASAVFQKKKHQPSRVHAVAPRSQCSLDGKRKKKRRKEEKKKKASAVCH